MAFFMDDDEINAYRTGAYLNPQGIMDADPKRQQALRDAATNVYNRAGLSRSLGNAAMAVAQANQKGGGIGNLFAALGGGFQSGQDEVAKQRYTEAQTRGALAQASKHEAEAKQYGAGGGTRPPVVRDQNGRVHRWNGKRYVAVPQFDQEGYKAVDLPPMPYDLNPDQTVFAKGGQYVNPPLPGQPPGQGQPQSTPSYYDQANQKWYDWKGGQWVPR